MADLEKAHEGADPEKVTELSQKTTYGNVDVQVEDSMFIHADPNDGDEACVAISPFPIPIPSWTIVRSPQLGATPTHQTPSLARWCSKWQILTA
jgi:hypothetical protein